MLFSYDLKNRFAKLTRKLTCLYHRNKVVITNIKNSYNKPDKKTKDLKKSLLYNFLYSKIAKTFKY